MLTDFLKSAESVESAPDVVNEVIDGIDPQASPRGYNGSSKVNLEEANTALRGTLRVEKEGAQGVLTDFLKSAESAESAPNVVNEVIDGIDPQASP